MKIIRILGLLGAAGAATVGAATATSTAAFAAPASVATTPAHTVDGVHSHVSERARSITTNLTELRTRITANPRLTAAAKKTLQADITKALADTATWQTRIAAATTMTAVRAAGPARAAVIADLTTFRTGLAAARAQAVAGRATTARTTGR
ncbi:MAG: hypothetical protein QOH97_2340 [Actinoplanes sp.]|nr:hypothetical protein [Actinoplanes sp.]